MIFVCVHTKSSEDGFEYYLRKFRQIGRLNIREKKSINSEYLKRIRMKGAHQQNISENIQELLIIYFIGKLTFESDEF